MIQHLERSRLGEDRCTFLESIAHQLIAKFPIVNQFLNRTLGLSFIQCIDQQTAVTVFFQSRSNHR